MRVKNLDPRKSLGCIERSTAQRIFWTTGAWEKRQDQYVGGQKFQG